MNPMICPACGSAAKLEDGEYWCTNLDMEPTDEFEFVCKMQSWIYL